MISDQCSVLHTMLHISTIRLVREGAIQLSKTMWSFQYLHTWAELELHPSLASSLPYSIMGPKHFWNNWSGMSLGIPKRRLHCRKKIGEVWIIHRNLLGSGFLLKQSQNKKGQKFVSAAPKMVSFFAASNRKKGTIFDAAETNFRPLLVWRGFTNF